MFRKCILGGACALVLTAPASAGLYDNIYRGLDLLATPSGGFMTTTADGTRINGARLGRMRLEHNRAGRGYDLQFDRTFGVDARGRPEVLDLGPYELELSGQTQATLGYTRGGFTARRGFYTGNAEIAANNLQYALRAKSGAQDAELVGSMSMVGTTEINMLGFYTVELNVNNANSELRLDGVLVEKQDDTDFDVGPITVRGNIFIDALSALLGGAGLETDVIERLFPKSPIGDITDSLIEQFRKQTLAAGLTLDGAPVHGVTLDGQDVITALLTPTDASLATLAAADAVAPQGANAPSDTSAGAVPEPTTIALLSVAGLALLAAARRRR
ncbi:MAG: PEP-CTERM sorting domain-containing protein [Phycisphaerales bacterium]|nr:PEP-CTERM sorting domain-containing protein [Phycisphaerales bacterium]